MHKLSSMLWLCTAALVASSLGCTMCSTDHLCDYAGVGGKWQRGNPTCGRVGSTLSDAGGYDNGGVVGSAAAFGDSWGLVEGHSISTEGSEVVEELVIEGDQALDDEAALMPESSSIIIGQ